MLIFCRECAHECSEKAGACPNCGCPLKPPAAEPPTLRMTDIERLAHEAIRARAMQPRPVVVRPVQTVQTIEKTAKVWKATMLGGGLLLFGGCAMVAVAMPMIETSEEYAGRVLQLGGILFLLGSATYITGRVLAWWYHG